MNIKGSFKSKEFKYGGYAALMTAAVLAIVIILNLIVGKLDIKYDLSKNKMFSLSDQTNKVIEGLKTDVKIYAFYESGKQDKIMGEILNKYKVASKKISFEYKDPVLYPEFAKKYSSEGKTVSQGSIVVESGSKFKVIDYYDLVNYNYSNPSGQPSVESLSVEQAVTGAIMYVTAQKNLTIYALQGHGEQDLSTEVKKQAEAENYTLKTINLISSNTAMEKGSVLLISSPQRDISKEESQKITDFLSDGGRAMFLIDLTQNELPNLSLLMNNYGLSIQRAIVAEGDVQHYTRAPIYLLPEINSHDITGSLVSNRLIMIVPVAQGLEIMKVKRPTLDIQPLLTTTKNSWGKKNLETNTIEKEAGDLTGPFNVAAAVTENNTKLVVVGNSTFTDSQFVSQSNSANMDFIMNSFNWLQDKKEGISIRPKSLVPENLNISSFQQLLFSGLVVIVIPIAVAVIGIAVWSRRRNK